MRASRQDSAATTGRRGDDERLVDLLAEQSEQDLDDEDLGRMYPMRLVDGEDDVRADTSYDRGGWSAEECAMHLVEEQ